MEDLAQQADQLNPEPMVNLRNLTEGNPFISPIRCTENKALGLSQIEKKELINLPPQMIRDLTTIFNAALPCGHFPNKFKTALITLIPTGCKPLNRPEIFWPISLFELFGKILEQILNSRLREHT